MDSVPANFSLLHEFFEAAVRKYPDVIAIDVPPCISRPEREILTYSELNIASEALAVHLRSKMQSASTVAILLPRNTAALYVAQLAVLKVGAAYVCLDPAFPDAQIQQILQDSEALVLLTDTVGGKRAKESQFEMGHVINVADVLLLSPPTFSPISAVEWLTPDSLAYVIYTSGTTGQPKGVQIAHRSIANLIRSDLEAFTPAPGDRVAQGSSSAYDSSVEETWLALASGATVVVMDDETVRSGPDLILWLRRERITVFCPPPTLLRATGCTDPQTALPELRLLYVGGEALPNDVVERWASGRRLVNGYGPTECTVTALRTDISPGQPISIGIPVAGVKAWVLDSNLQPVEDGISGELCLGGEGLAVGYHRRPDLTAEKFPVHPRWGRLYRTGDKAYRSADGAFFYEGRLDAQVKLRGYRIELEAIETCLVHCEGIREAACRVQTEGSQQTLVAFVVPSNPTEPPDFVNLKESLGRALPVYMVPAHFGLIDELPKSVGGKVKRDALPVLKLHHTKMDRPLMLPRNAIESSLAEAFAATLGIHSPLSIEDDFFSDLGGNSLQAAQLISHLRGDSVTASLTVRDIYEARTVSELARRVLPLTTASPAVPDNRPQPIHPFRATVFQSLWLALELAVGTFAAYFSGLHVLPWLLHNLGLFPLILILPLIVFCGLLTYTLLAVGAAVAVKRLLIGRYRPMHSPVWSDFYVRHWIVLQVVRLIPWQVLSGTEFQMMALRALGARIGKRVHLHRGVDLLEGGWDLMTIEDDVTLNQDASVRLVELIDAQVVVGSITLKRGATLEVRAGVASNTCLEANSYLTALSSLPQGGRIPEGERWDGIPAQPAGNAPTIPSYTTPQKELSPISHGIAFLCAKLLLATVLALPYELCTLGWVWWSGLNSAGLMDFLFTSRLMQTLPVLALLAVIPLPLTLILEALLVRGMGRLSEGVISRWSLAYLPVWLKAGLVDSAGTWLSGALFWPFWLRLAGMRVGANCEISTIIDVIPEMIDIAPETFFADGIYLGGPVIHRGTVSLKRVSFQRNTFLGNHVIVAGGQHLPEDILLGVCTVADDTVIRPDSSWFGHPPFELPRREVVECDRSLTYSPTPIRYLNRLFWESLRLILPVVPAVLAFGWLRVADYAEVLLPSSTLLFALPLISLVFALLPCLLILLLKWGLLGRVRPGTHPLWSCWCSRWDFLYVAWGVYARGILSALEGTELLTWYLRAIGMKIGRGVILGSGFSQVVDPDMLEFEEGATVNAIFQAHTFEDRVLKIDCIRVGKQATLGSGSVPLYGAEIGANTLVAPHSVIMKQELLLPGLVYEGAPTRPRSKTQAENNADIPQENFDPQRLVTSRQEHTVAGG